MQTEEREVICDENVLTVDIINDLTFSFLINAFKYRSLRRLLSEYWTRKI